MHVFLLVSNGEFDSGDMSKATTTTAHIRTRREERVDCVTLGLPGLIHVW